MQLAAARTPEFLITRPRRCYQNNNITIIISSAAGQQPLRSCQLLRRFCGVPSPPPLSSIRSQPSLPARRYRRFARRRRAAYNVSSPLQTPRSGSPRQRLPDERVLPLNRARRFRASWPCRTYYYAGRDAISANDLLIYGSSRRDGRRPTGHFRQTMGGPGQGRIPVTLSRMVARTQAVGRKAHHPDGRRSSRRRSGKPFFRPPGGPGMSVGRVDNLSGIP